jgi:hypothetical protein
VCAFSHTYFYENTNFDPITATTALFLKRTAQLYTVYCLFRIPSGMLAKFLHRGENHRTMGSGPEFK